MKHLPVILIAFSLFTALLVGCGGSHDARVTAELDRADSLLRTSDTAAHSAALRQMLALDTARALQVDEALRARHALLLTQAQFKCYAFPSNDSLINIARNYYANHHSSAQDRELYTRSLIYSGAVAQMTDNPQQVMQWYLEAESAADPNDHFNLGYTNLRIAELYEGEFVTDSTDIVRLKQALPHFVKAGSDYYQAVCLTGIGGLYRTHNNDSALHYLQQAISFSKEHGLTYNYYEALDKLCGLYYYLEDYTKSKDLATKIYRENQGIYDGTKYLSCGVKSFAKLGRADSAELLFKLMPLPITKVDSMIWLDDLAEIYRANSDYRNYSTFAIRSDSIADMIMLNSHQAQLKEAEAKYGKTELQLKNAQLRNKLLVYSVIILILLAIFGYFIYNYKQNKKKWQSLVTELYENRNELEGNHTDLLAATKKHEALRTLLMQHFKLMDELIKLGDSNPNSKLSQQLKDQIRATYSDKNFVTEMRNFVSMHADETLTDFLASCDKNLNETENNIVTLTACGFSSPEIALLTNQKDASYIRVVRHRISKKFNLDTPLEQYLSAHFKL